MSSDLLENVQFSGGGAAVVIIDQTLLPNQIRYLELSEANGLREAIVSLRVRGAPAIGIFAAYALSVLARQIDTSDYAVFRADGKIQRTRRGSRSRHYAARPKRQTAG